MNDPILVAFAVLFIAMLILRFVRGILISRRLGANNTLPSSMGDSELESLIDSATDNAKVREALKSIEARASSSESAQQRAMYHCARGHLSLTKLKRPGLAVGFYLRALREDPTAIDALDKLQEILTAQKRLKRLEWTYWAVLGRLDDAEVGSKIWIKCWSGLASIYSTSPRTTPRADAIRKSLAAYLAIDDIGENITSLPQNVTR